MKCLTLVHRSIAVLCLLTGFVADTPAQDLVRSDIRAAEGYRLIARLNETGTSLIDKSNNVVHKWTSNYQLATVAYLLPNGNLLRMCSLANDNIRAGGGGGRLEILSWDSSVLWSYEYNLPTAVMHHDVKLMPNGNFLVLLWELKSRQEALDAGLDPERVTNRGILSESVIEVKPTEAGGEIVWKWSLWDHMVQELAADKPNYGLVAEHPELINVHYAANPSTADWFHANSVDYNPTLDQIVISVRALSEIWIIDHSTTTEEAASHSGGRYGKGGDLLYRWGNPVVWSGGGDDRQQIDVQHNAHWIEPGKPGAGNILIFSNLIPGVTLKSRVVEIKLPLNPDGSYYREEGKEFGPDGFVWSYESPAPNEFYSFFISGATRLPNGNTLICSGAQAQVFEVSREGEVLWTYWDGGINNPKRVNIFRSYWYPASFTGFEGTPLYAPPLTVMNAGTIRPGAMAPDSMVYAAASSLDNPTVEVIDGSGKAIPAAIHTLEPASMTFVMPGEAAAGPGRVIVRNAAGAEYRLDIRIDRTAPGIFAAGGNGVGAGAIYFERGDTGEMLPAFYFDEESVDYAPAPISTEAMEGGVYLFIPVTGIRLGIPEGKVEVTVGDFVLPLVDIRPHTDLPGVDMVKVGPLPMILAASGTQPVVVSAEGVKSNSVQVSLQ